MKDYVVTFFKGGYSSSRCRYDYIVTAKNKTEAKRKIKDYFFYNVSNVSATLTTDYKSLNPYSVFERL